MQKIGYLTSNWSSIESGLDRRIKKRGRATVRKNIIFNSYFLENSKNLFNIPRMLYKIQENFKK